MPTAAADGNSPHVPQPPVEDPAHRPLDAARAAGLRYTIDTRPGIRRRRHRGGFRYVMPDGRPVRDPDVLRRIHSLAIPPAWTDVWICPQANGHLQATGRDARGRKQYRYHPRWRETRDEVKYGRMVAFGHALEAIRARTEADLARKGLPKDKVLATVVRLLETTLIRVGNDEYAKTNRSFGLTTMRDRHADVQGGRLRFHFTGKSGKQHDVTLTDRRLARIVQRCKDIPGYELFQFIGDDCVRHTIDSADINAYLRDITGEDFTAKDFRTWAGTVLAALALNEFERFDSEAQAKRNVVRAIEAVAEHLGNTPTICRKCYVHPAIIEMYLDGSLLETLRQRTEAELSGSLGRLSAEEGAVLGVLQQRLRIEGPER